MGLKISTKVEVEASVEEVAKWFAELNDRHQADFFVHVAEASKEWTGDFGTQWLWVGMNLQENEKAVDVIRGIVSGIECKKELS